MDKITTTTTTNNNTKKKVFATGKFRVAKITSVDEKSIVLKFPKEILQYLGVERKTVYWTTVNGVIQLSGGHPSVTIPVLNVFDGQFVARE